MEIFLSVIILIFIIIIFSKQNSNLNLLRKDISLLKDLINNLKSEIAKQEIKSVQEVIIPKITPKVEDVKPITPIVQEQKVEKPIQIPNAQIVQQQPIKPTIRVENTSINVQATPNVQRPITPKIPQKPVDNRSFWDKFREKNPDLEKFVGENLISKIGIVMLVLGIAYFGSINR